MSEAHILNGSDRVAAEAKLRGRYLMNRRA